MSRGARIAVLVIGLVLAAVAANAIFPFVWYSPAISGSVIDEATRAPVANAVVLLNWELKDRQGLPLRQLAIHETVTDEKGQFRVPAWGPRISFRGGRLMPGEPTTRILHDSYHPQAFRNVVATSQNLAPMVSDARSPIVRYRRNGQRFALRPLMPAESVRGTELAAFASTMWFAYFGKECEWTKSIEALELLESLRQRALRDGADGRLAEVRPLEDVVADSRCEQRRPE